MQVERRLGPRCVAPFPIYLDVVGDLVTGEGHAWNANVAHVLVTCASYCYADLDTVATMAVRLGMDACSCVQIQQTVDAMYIYSTAYLVQSRCGFRLSASLLRHPRQRRQGCRSGHVAERSPSSCTQG